MSPSHPALPAVSYFVTLGRQMQKRGHTMRRSHLMIGLALGALLPLGAMAADQHTIVAPESIVWKAAPPAYPKGAQMAILYGDPTKEGPFAVRMKLPAGYK